MTNPIDPTNLKYVATWNDDHPDVFDNVEALSAEFGRNKAQYVEFQERRNEVELTPPNVRRAMAWTVVSIKTDTSRVDSLTDALLSGDFAETKRFVESSTDGQVKWEKIHNWLTSDIPERVVEYLKDGQIDHAHALIAGRDPETAKQVTKTYLRTCKASLVLYFLGFDRMCIDSRIWQNLNPTISALIMDRPVAFPDTEYENPYRIRENMNMPTTKVGTLTHSGDPDVDENQTTFWEDRLKWNPREYHALEGFIRDTLTEHSDVPRELIPIVAFNMGTDETTTHKTLMDQLTN